MPKRVLSFIAVGVMACLLSEPAGAVASVWRGTPASTRTYSIQTAFQQQALIAKISAALFRPDRFRPAPFFNVVTLGLRPPTTWHEITHKKPLIEEAIFRLLPAVGINFLSHELIRLLLLQAKYVDSVAGAIASLNFDLILFSTALLVFLHSFFHPYLVQDLVEGKAVPLVPSSEQRLDIQLAGLKYATPFILVLMLESILMAQSVYLGWVRISAWIQTFSWLGLYFAFRLSVAVHRADNLDVKKRRQKGDRSGVFNTATHWPWLTVQGWSGKRLFFPFGVFWIWLNGTGLSEAAQVGEVLTKKEFWIWRTVGPWQIPLDPYGVVVMTIALALCLLLITGFHLLHDWREQWVMEKFIEKISPWLHDELIQEFPTAYPRVHRPISVYAEALLSRRLGGNVSIQRMSGWKDIGVNARSHVWLELSWKRHWFFRDRLYFLSYTEGQFQMAPDLASFRVMHTIKEFGKEYRRRHLDYVDFSEIHVPKELFYKHRSLRSTGPDGEQGVIDPARLERLYERARLKEKKSPSKPSFPGVQQIGTFFLAAWLGWQAAFGTLPASTNHALNTAT